MTSAENRKEENVINSCILRSIDIAKLEAGRISNAHTKFFVNRSLRCLRSSGYVKSIEEELNQMVDDHKMSIAMLLRPLFTQNGISFSEQINGRDAFWFSTRDLKNGYVILYNDVRVNTATHVLFLNNLESPFLSQEKTIEPYKVKAGEVLPFSEAAHLLTRVKGVWNDGVLYQVRKKLTEK